MQTLIMPFMLSRVLFSTAHDGLIPGMFSGVHNKFKTPIPAILLQVCMHRKFNVQGFCKIGLVLQAAHRDRTHCITQFISGKIRQDYNSSIMAAM